MYHALHILLRRPFLRSAKRSVRDQSMAHCVSHSKMIHDIQILYNQSFPYRLMTYQVSYCIYTAATIDVLEMKRSIVPGGDDASKRLSTAIRTLQNEARHTPGSGRSLDTIRRQLSVWENTQGMKTSRKRLHDHDIDEDVVVDVATLPTGPGARSQPSEPTASSMGVLPDVANEGNSAQDSWASSFAPFASVNALNPILSEFPTISSGQSPAGDGALNSGAGFHPEAFSWGFYDQI